MTIHPWEAFLAGALVAADAARPANTPQPPEVRAAVDISWVRDVPVVMRLCRAAGYGDQAKIEAELRDADPRALLATAVGMLVGLATVAVARGEADDIESVFTTWSKMARQA